MAWNIFNKPLAGLDDGLPNGPIDEGSFTKKETDFFDKIIKILNNNPSKVAFFDKPQDNKGDVAAVGMELYIYRKVTLDTVTNASSPIASYQIFVELSSLKVVLRILERGYEGGRQIYGKQWPVVDIPLEIVLIEGTEYYDKFHRLKTEIEGLQKQMAESRRDNLIDDFLTEGEMTFDNPIEKIFELSEKEKSKATPSGSKFVEPTIMNFDEQGQKE